MSVGILTTSWNRTQPTREAIAWRIVKILKPLYFFFRKNKKAWKITMDDLRQMPMGTLGNDVYHFLIKNNLKLIPKAEVHDVHHVLFQYSTDIHDETCIEFVPLGNGRLTVPYLAATFVAFVLFPEFWSDFYRSYLRGKNVSRFHDVDFEPLLHLKTIDVRKMIVQKI